MTLEGGAETKWKRGRGLRRLRRWLSDFLNAKPGAKTMAEGECASTRTLIGFDFSYSEVVQVGFNVGVESNIGGNGTTTRC